MNARSNIFCLAILGLLVATTSITLAAEGLRCDQSRVLNERFIRKLCPNSNERCKARDNLCFFLETDPAYLKRITKPNKKDVE